MLISNLGFVLARFEIILRPLLEITKENKKPGNMKILMHTFSWKATSKNFSFWENAIRTNETMRDILKKGYNLTFLYTPSNGEFENISSTLQYSEFADELIKEMLRASTIKECL